MSTLDPDTIMLVESELNPQQKISLDEEKDAEEHFGEACQKRLSGINAKGNLQFGWETNHHSKKKRENSNQLKLTKKHRLKT